jgi:hypothetical protein
MATIMTRTEQRILSLCSISQCAQSPLPKYLFNLTKNSLKIFKSENPQLQS